MANKLRPYQKECVNTVSIALIEKNYRAYLIADETGLGKSPEALGIATKAMKVSKHDKVLVLCPAFLRKKWMSEIKKWAPKKRQWSIIIKTYSEIIDVDILHYITQYRFGFAIFDESHYLKSFEAQRTMAVYGFPGCSHKPVVKVCEKFVCLTATPIPEGRVGEIYTFMWASRHPGLKGLTYENFIKRWAEKHRETQWGLTHKGVSDPAALRKILWSRMIRRKKRDVQKELPPGIRDFVTMPCTVAAYKEENALLAEMLEKSGYTKMQIRSLLKNPDMLIKILQSMPTFEKYSVFKKQQGLIKVKPVVDYLVNNVLPEHRKFIIFTYHIEVANSYAEQLTKKLKKLKIKIPVTVVTSQNTQSDDRQDVLDKINPDENHILVATMGAIKEGFDLIGFARSYYTESHYSPYFFEQTEGRTLRYGQKAETVFWVYLVFDKGLEPYIYAMVNEKEETNQALLG